MVFHWNLSDNKSPQVSGDFHNILADLNNTVIWMMSIRLLIFKSSSPFTKPLSIVLSAPITIDITVTFVFHFFLVLCEILTTYLSFRFYFSFSFSGLPKHQVHNLPGSLFSVRSCLQAEIR